MIQFNQKNVFILPHAEEYRNFYAVGLDEILKTLNNPEVQKGVSDDRYTVEKQFGKRRIYVYYYRTLPLLNRREDALCAVVDFVSLTDESVNIVGR